MCDFLLIELASRRVGEKSLEEWLTILEGSSFPYGPVNSISEVFKDPQVGANICVVANIRDRDSLLSTA